MALLHMDFFSNVLGMCVEADVILPEATDGQIGMEGEAGDSYPTLYLLHGMSDDHTIWQRRTSIERYVSTRNLAVVMPSTHLAWYTDTAYGLDYFTYITQELPAVCRRFFPGMSAKREDNYIAGLSMGGYGAFKAALTCPDNYAAAASLSGALYLDRFIARMNDSERGAYWRGIFGDPASFAGSRNDLFHLADECAARFAQGKPVPRLFQWCGTEDDLLADGRQMRDRLRQLGFDLQYSESEGNHSWPWWDEQIQNVLAWIDAMRS